MWTCSELKSRGKIAFKSNYWKCVLAALILMLLTASAANNDSSPSAEVPLDNGVTLNFSGLAAPFGLIAEQLGLGTMMFAGIFTGFLFLIALAITIGLKFFIFNPLIVGCQGYFVDNAYVANGQYSEDYRNLRSLARVFQSPYYLNVVKVMFLRDLYIALWTLLLVIPGIVKSYEYRMIPYLLAEDPSLSSDEAFAMTKQMMTGEKLNAFILDLSFIGWTLLSGFTLGISGIFYSNPYQSATNSELYLQLKGGKRADFTI